MINTLANPIKNEKIDIKYFLNNNYSNIKIKLEIIF